MWLVCCEDGELVATTPLCLSLPSGLETGHSLVALLDEAERTLRSVAPDAVLILEPEATNRLTFTQSRRRVTGETLLSLAAARLDLPCDYMSRPKLRALLKLPKKGALADLASEVIGSPLSPHWKNKRDLAALTALAGDHA